MAEETQEKVWVCRKSKAPLLGRERGGGEALHGNLPVRTCMGSQSVGCLWCRLLLARSHLLWLWKTGRFLFRLWVDGHLLCGLRAAGAKCEVVSLQVARTDCDSHLGGQREAWPATSGVL